MMSRSIVAIEKQSKISNGTKGGARIGAGRKKGEPNKIVREVKEMAQGYGEQAIEVLANLMTTAQSESTKVMAAKELLDRAYGKATNHAEITGKDGKDLVPDNQNSLMADIYANATPEQMLVLYSVLVTASGCEISEDGYEVPIKRAKLCLDA